MSPPSRKQARKQKKQRDRRQRKVKSQTGAQQPFPPSPRVPALPRLAPKSKPDPETLSPIERWWNEYSDADGQGRLQMTRDKLATVSPDDDWFESLFPEAIMEMESELSEGEYVAFLEQLRNEHSEVFELSLDWHTQSMVSHYVAENRMEDVDRAAEYLAVRMEDLPSPFFSLVSMIRLAGRAEAAQRLVDAAMPLIGESDLMGWAVHSLIELALYGPVQACVAAGATEEAIEEVYQKSLLLGANDTNGNREIQREHIAHIAGTSDRVWTRKLLLDAGENAGQEIYVLLYDYMRWLCQQRGFQPVVADELRRILASTINGMECQPNAVLRGLKQKEFEPALAKKLAFMSLERFHAPAAVVAMRHFYDFLQEQGLVDKRTRDTAHNVCYVLWRKLKKAMVKEWDSCRFLESYLPSSTSAN